MAGEDVLSRAGAHRRRLVAVASVERPADRLAQCGRIPGRHHEPRVPRLEVLAYPRDVGGDHELSVGHRV